MRRTFTSWCWVVLALLLVSLSVRVSANPFVRNKAIRLELDRTIVLQYRAAPGAEPWDIPVDMQNRSATGNVPSDPQGEILIFVRQGKAPEVRGERTLEKKTALIKYRRLWGSRMYQILDRQNKASEERKLKELMDEDLGQRFKNDEDKERYIKNHLLYQGVLEGSIPVREFRPNDDIWIEVDFDLNEPGYHIRLTVKPWTLREMLALQAQLVPGSTQVVQTTPPPGQPAPGMLPPPTAAPPADPPLDLERERRFEEEQRRRAQPPPPSSTPSFRVLLVNSDGTPAGDILPVGLMGFDEQGRRVTSSVGWVQRGNWVTSTGNLAPLPQLDPNLLYSVFVGAGHGASWLLAGEPDRWLVTETSGRPVRVKTWKSRPQGLMFTLQRVGGGN